ncbi:MAG: exo-alpha-sialidase [Bryobacterales bacterium]|nr:exo-alpha-sialidase [Bryobacterales bacterium]
MPISRFALVFLLTALSALAAPRFEAEFLFPLEHWHNHSSSVVELPGGDLFAVWYNGSGERTADDVKLEGARWNRKTRKWSDRFPVADVASFPDCNPIIWLDQERRLWLSWPTIVANEWHTSILQYRVFAQYPEAGKAVRWQDGGIVLFEPRNFEARVKTVVEPMLAQATEERVRGYLKEIIARAGDKYYRRMGWMPRTHPIALPSGRWILPLYSDGYDFSVVAYSDDGGKTWNGSEPMMGWGAVQPSIVRKKDGTLVSWFRDNGPAPHRVLRSESRDDGISWTVAADTDIPNSGTSLEVIVLQSGEWLMVNNDTEEGRYSLSAWISGDEGASWKWKRHIELDNRKEQAGSFHYPSVIQASDGTIHVTYSYFLNHIPKDGPRKSIKHAAFNVDWVKEGDR